MVAALETAGHPLVYVPKFREFGLLVDGGPPYDHLDFCPWCGQPLPSSLRDEFFDRLDEMGLEPDSPELPLDFRSDAWWRMRSLG